MFPPLFARFSSAALVGLALLFPAPQSQAQTPQYVGSQTCASCHQEAYDAWAGSHHAQAWRAPSAALFEGGFEGEVFEQGGMRAQFSKDGDALRVTVREIDGASTDYSVHSVAGTAPLLQLIFETKKGRMQSFDVVWDVNKRVWYHLYPDQELPPQEAFHWTGPYKNWNARCAECHATGFEKNYDFKRRRYNSTQAEIGVGCEACHGPGEAHVLLQKQDQGQDQDWPDYVIPLSAQGFSAQMSDPNKAMQQCAGCHARREAFGDGNPQPGTRFEDAYNLAMLRPGLYHADGQILDEVYVYGSFLQSKMKARGVTCSNCHTPHSAELVATGNATCTQCHSEAANPDFKSLRRADYDTPEHHRHAQDSAGGQCVNCHMIERTYMGIDGRRDHSFRVPRPDLVPVTDAPDACTDCHADRTPVWAAEQIAAWYPNGRQTEPHFSTVLASGRKDATVASDALFALAQSADQPELVRATALWLLGRAGTKVTLSEVGGFLSSDDPVIRVGAVNALRGRASIGSAPFLITALQDPVRNVRVAAARAVLSQTPQRMAPALRPYVAKAYAELARVFKNQFDFPEAHLQLGGYALVSGNDRAAIQALREAVRLDPQNTRAWSTLVRVTARAEGRKNAQKRLREGLAFNPDDPDLQILADEF